MVQRLTSGRINIIFLQLTVFVLFCVILLGLDAVRLAVRYCPAELCVAPSGNILVSFLLGLVRLVHSSCNDW